MALIYGRNYTRREILERVGDVSQIAGVKKVRLADGNEEGVEAFLFKTGSGFSFTVLPGRGMDISYADWRGRSIGWISQTGQAAPQFYEQAGTGWLRSFYGGLLTTCGLTYAGAPCVDQGKELGLHGRVSNIPACCVSYDCEWEGDDYLIWARGKVRESAVFGENLVLTRRISTKMGDDRLWIEDTVENRGHEPTPHMMLYHINIGFPIVDAGSVLTSPTKSVSPRDKDAETGVESYNIFEPPTAGFRERVYYHEMEPDSDGKITAALVNHSIAGGFGFYVKYSKEELPFFTEWKMNGLGTYVVGMEPGNCHVEGRAKERERGTLQILEPDESRSYSLELGVVAQKT
ncbi:MAG: aldose 1-epimerase family protein [Armatimonadetes bacterium]|nr:aldose 1-epimerase family protein [Armatimonadota bacterium]